MKDLTKEEISGAVKTVVATISELIESKAFNAQHFTDLMKPLSRNYRFDIEDYISYGNQSEVAEYCFDQLTDSEKNNILGNHGFASRYSIEEELEDETRQELGAKNLMEEDVDELLAQLKRKYDYLPNLEKALGTKLVAEVRGEKDPTPPLDQKNYDPNCYCSRVVNIEPYEIESCCERKGLKAEAQWVGSNHEGNFVRMTCICGKVSRSYLED